VTDATLPLSRPDRLPRFAGFGVVFRWGLRRALRAKRFRIAAVLLALLGLGLGYAATHDADPIRVVWDTFDVGILGIGIPLVALSLIGGGYAEEIDEQTLVYHLVRPVRRSTIFQARFVAGAIPGVVAAAAMTGAMLLVSKASPGTGATTSMIAVSAIGVMTVGAVYYALAALFRRGLVAGLVYTFVAEGAFQWLPGGIQRLSLMHHVRSLYHNWTDDAFAATSESIRRTVDAERRKDLGDALRDPTDMLRQALREPWTSTTTALLICAGVVVAALVIGSRAVSKKDYALKE